MQPEILFGATPDEFFEHCDVAHRIGLGVVRRKILERREHAQPIAAVRKNGTVTALPSLASVEVAVVCIDGTPKNGTTAEPLRS